jgi:4-hydroxybenzoate polyprenyltransferase
MLANQADSLQFIFYILASVMIAAAGYLHNNYLDQEVDQLNGKKTKFTLSLPYAKIIFVVLNLIAISFLFIFEPRSVLLFGIVPILLLLLYNFYLKKIGLIGNLLVAFLASYQLMGLLICDLPIGDQVFWDSTIFQYILFLFGSSFLIMLSREIVKDIEDQQGDKQMHYKTLPIVVGQKASKVLVGVLILSTLFYFISFIAQNEIGSWISYIVVFFILLVLLVAFFSIVKSNVKKDFTEVSTLLKISIGLAAALLIFIP